jgi:hypothetical protein
MAKKPTKRKAFNFLRSYYDVLNELTSNEDKISFLTAILDKQFIDEDPQDLNFLVNICYESQRHSIEQSVRGYKQKMKTDLLGNPIEEGTQGGTQGGYVGGRQGGRQAPSVQEKEKEKEKEKYTDAKGVEYTSKEIFDKYKSLISKWNEIKNTRFKPSKNNLKNFKYWFSIYSAAEIVEAIKNHDDSFWMQKLTPQFIFRQSNKNGAADYIAELLQHRPKQINL